MAFYAEAILSKKGPLAKIWLAAHYERKLSKQQTLQTDIGQSAKAIEARPMALRISGQLLLGVCRIYSRKAKYLLDDCNEALLKIKLAFRPGVVDMTDEQLAVPRGQITLQGDGIDIDIFNEPWAFAEPRESGGKHLAREADINLPMQQDFFMDLDAGADWNFDDAGGFGELGVDFGDGFDDSMAVEMGRDAVSVRSARHSLASALQGRGNDEFDRMSMHSRDMGDFGDDINFADAAVDLNLDFDGGAFDLGGQEKTPGASRASSPLTAPPATPPPGEPPKSPRKSPKKRKLKEKKQAMDRVTELQDGPGPKIRGSRDGLDASTKVDVSEIVTHHGYLSNSPIISRLLEIRNDPLAHFFPIKVTDKGTFLSVAPPGIAPEIADLFLFPTSGNQGQKRKATDQKSQQASKRPRLDKAGEEDDVEDLRHRAGNALPGLEADYGDINAGFGDDSGFMIGDDAMPMDDGFMLPVDDSLDIPEIKLNGPVREFADEDCPVAMFDSQPQASQMIEEHGQTLKQKITQGNEEQEEEKVSKDGYSKNTVRAVNLLKEKLGEMDLGGKNQALGFNELTDKASRRAASTFFFELLVLGTRDCVGLSQKGSFRNIRVSPKENLWITQGPDMERAAPVLST